MGIESTREFYPGRSVARHELRISQERVGIRLFKRTWKNPAPETPLESIDFAASDTGRGPFLLAITAEE